MDIKLSNIFKKNVFDKKKMCEFLSKDAFVALEKWIEEDSEINEAHANEIANTVKNWALSMGATHYTHWFQPLNGKSAEKHNSFLSIDNNGEVIEKLSGSSLISAEADASSFPSGGLRNTFEARGYVAWDASSPLFILDNGGVKTLCIPSVFITYNGESVDQKLPLLKSKAVLSEKCKELLKLFGKDTKEVYSTVGLEQEYFLVNKSDFAKRDDLKMLGKTLFGIKSPKTQQMQDQYLGIIKSKILKYMNDVEIESCKYGIPLSTRHNEVAPNQFEFAPIYEEANLANDHNQLLMILMNDIAEKNDLVCLLNEKPFQDVNGSGKHLNWSLSDAEGNNLLQCGKNSRDNLQFLTFITIIIQAVCEHSDLLLASIASPGNEARLGGHEAPPSIISVFLGHFLDKILNAIEKNSDITSEFESKIISNFKKVPNFLMDNTDRNRTSPFAFTGNKFEFRAVGSSQNVATPITILNVIVADSIDKTIKLIEQHLSKKETFEVAILKTIKDIIIKTKKIRFEKDGYSKDWEKEAEKRGLITNKNIFASIKELISDKNIELFKKYDVLSKEELTSRTSAWSNIYITNKKIEINVLLEFIDSKIIPDTISYRSLLLNDLRLSKDLVNISLLKNEKKLLKDYSKLIDNLFSERDKLEDSKKIFKSKDEVESIEFIYSTINPILNDIRNIINELEKKTGDKYWSSAKYKEFLF
jgi:glutamine synthetase